MHVLCCSTLGHSSIPFSCGFLKNGLFAATCDGSIQVWDTERRKLLFALSGAKAPSPHSPSSSSSSTSSSTSSSSSSSSAAVSATTSASASLNPSSVSSVAAASAGIRNRQIFSFQLHCFYNTIYHPLFFIFLSLFPLSTDGGNGGGTSSSQGAKSTIPFSSMTIISASAGKNVKFLMDMIVN